MTYDIEDYYIPLSERVRPSENLLASRVAEITHNLELQKVKDPIDAYVERQAKIRSYVIDAHLRIYIKDKKWWCPNWLYKKIIRSHIEVIQIKNL